MATAEIWTGGLMEDSTTTAAAAAGSPVSTPSENGAVSLRRRRMEIRRIKMMTTTTATSSGFEQPVSKRLRPVWGGAGLRSEGGGGGGGSELPAAGLQQVAWESPLSGGDGVLCDGDECETVGDQSSDRMMHQRSESSDEGSSVTFAPGFHGALGAEGTAAVTGAATAAAAAGDSFASAGVQSVGAAAAPATAATTAATAAATATAAAAAAPAGSEEMGATETVTEAEQLVGASLWRGEGSGNESNAAAAMVAGDAGGAAGAPGDCFASNACPPHGMVSLCGRRREMEDAVVSKDSFVMLPCNQVGGCNASGVEAAPLHYFGVYDGHGGSQAANFCAERLHQALAEEVATCFVQGQNVEEVDWESKWLTAMTQCFKRMDAEVGGFCLVETECQSGDNPRCCPEPIAPETVGTTAIVAVVGACQIIVGNCGDSRAVLSRGGVAIPLSVDHKPEREDEMARVEAAGGRVIYWNGYRVLGVLAMSRAIGDRYLKPYVIPEPEVKCVKRAEDDECLILASDGLWDVMSNEVVCDIARRALNCRRNGQPPDPSLGSTSDEESPAAQAAALLVKLALAKGSSDNISVVVVDLKVNR